MQLNIDIEGMIAQSLHSALSEEKLLPLIQSNVERAIKSAIEEQFSYRGAFNELLKEKVALAMPSDIENFGRFGDLVLKSIKEQIGNYQNDFIKQAITPRLERLLEPLPASMNLSELVKKFTDSFSNDYKRDGDSQPTFIFESQGSHWHLYADPRSDKGKYQCKIMLRFESKANTCWGCTIDENDITNKKYIGPMFNDEALALNLYTGQIKIEVDETDFSDVYYDGGEDD